MLINVSNIALSNVILETGWCLVMSIWAEDGRLGKWGTGWALSIGLENDMFLFLGLRWDML